MEWKLFIFITGYLFGFGSFLILFYLFIQAYLNGMDHVIYINYYGEANFELIVLCIIEIFLIMGLFILIKDLEYYKE